jgi:hypothetical protein
MSICKSIRSLAILAALTTLTLSAAQAQSGVWTWIGGSNLANPAHTDGYPDARFCAAYWQDTNGNFWMFGGLNLGGELNDLWEYNPTTGHGSMVTGTATPNQPGVYGTQGVAGALNTPGSRCAPAYAIDANNNLWLFGGSGRDVSSVLGDLNDIWEFDTVVKEWIWWGGSQTVNQSAVYGAIGAGSTTYQPNGEYSSAMWIDASGNSWIYGGDSFLGSVDDVWEFTPSNKFWTLQNGHPGGPFYAPQVYSGSPSAITPGGTYWGTSWVDASGNFRFLDGYNDGLSSYTNTLWTYSTTTNTWTFDNPATYTNGLGVYSSLGTFNATNIPGARYTATAATTSNGMLVLFGGYGYDQSSFGWLNDLSAFKDSDSEWALFSGSSTGANIAGVYGTQGTPSASNYPGARFSSVAWIDINHGNLYILGGNGFDSVGTHNVLNDFWEFSPNGIAATPVITPGSQNIYTPITVTITDSTPGATIYYTSDGSTPDINNNPSTRTYSGPFTIGSTSTVVAIATANGYANSPQASATYTQANYFWGPYTTTFTYGYSLGAIPNLLNAVISVPGNVNYFIHGTPVSGATVLNVGQYQLDAIFTSPSSTYLNKISYKITVAPATLVVTPLSVVVTYGSPVPHYNYSITGYVNGDTAAAVTGVPTINANATSRATTTGAVVYTSNIGLYAIHSAQGSLRAANYTFSFQSALLAINPCTCSLTVIPYDDVITQGSPIPSSFAYKVTGFLNWDNAANQLTGTAATSTNAVNGSPHGYYTIYSGPGSLTQLYGNYAGINYSNATLTIH